MLYGCFHLGWVDAPSSDWLSRVPALSRREQPPDVLLPYSGTLAWRDGVRVAAAADSPVPSAAAQSSRQLFIPHASTRHGGSSTAAYGCSIDYRSRLVSLCRLVKLPICEHKASDTR